MAMGFNARAIDFAKFGALFLDQGHLERQADRPGDMGK
jgi:hypothetical protein